MLQEFAERCWVKKEKLLSWVVKKMVQFQVLNTQMEGLGLMSGSAACTPRIVLGECKEGWSRRMVVLAKKKVVDWKIILDAVMSRISTLDLAVLVPFDDRKVVLDLGDFQAEPMDFEMLEGAIYIVKWTPSCNEISISEGSVSLKIFGLLFNLWLDHVFIKIATVCEVLEDTCLIDLHATRIKVAGIKLDRIPRLVNLYVVGKWWKFLVVVEAEAALWYGGREVEDDVNWALGECTWHRAEGEGEKEEVERVFDLKGLMLNKGCVQFSKKGCGDTNVEIGNMEKRGKKIKRLNGREKACYIWLRGDFAAQHVFLLGSTWAKKRSLSGAGNRWALGHAIGSKERN
uniref:DUF4283 domain-containing protein n=1 Tax=Nelumbo nucifera TaxID=4432 RepID=A0A822XT40_NELNU|nr:TPA_asm: hypothetical protein HUJ06_024645 [Nelumbo nucifera]